MNDSIVLKTKLAFSVLYICHILKKKKRHICLDCTFVIFWRGEGTFVWINHLHHRRLWPGITPPPFNFLHIRHQTFRIVGGYFVIFNLPTSRWNILYELWRTPLIYCIHCSTTGASVIVMMCTINVTGKRLIHADQNDKNKKNGPQITSEHYKWDQRKYRL